MLWLPVLGAGVVGDFVVDEPLPPPIEPDELPLEPEELPVEPDELPVAPEVLPPALEGLLVLPLEELEPDLLKWASHSWRETWPSLLVSTDEKLGCEALPELELGEALELELPPLAALPLDLPEAEPPLEDVDGEAADGLVDEDEESAATASVERAKRTAAVVTVTDLRMVKSSLGWGCPRGAAIAMPGAGVSGYG
ncbi:MAG TPA: hypothetical protein VM140_04015 [Burkholderiales bacterium]|nr:hypothetical protein [Burkholderiales bacterium]